MDNKEEFIDLEDAGKTFNAQMGAEAVMQLLKQIDIDEVAVTLRAQAKVEIVKSLKSVAGIITLHWSTVKCYSLIEQAMCQRTAW